MHSLFIAIPLNVQKGGFMRQCYKHPYHWFHSLEYVLNDVLHNAFDLSALSFYPENKNKKQAIVLALCLSSLWPW